MTDTAKKTPLENEDVLLLNKIIEEYKELNDKCDNVLIKITKRKNKKKRNVKR